MQEYGVTGSLSVNHHSTLVLTVKSGTLDFIGNYNLLASNRRDAHSFQPAKDNLNLTQWSAERFDGKCKEFVTEVIAAMMDGNHNNSDSQSDYFDVGWYMDISIGKWNKPYQLESEHATV